MQANENQLVLRSKNGDQTAFEKLYREHVGRIYALCLRMCGQKELAEDLTQEAFVRAWQKLGSFRGDSAFGSWLYRLTSNVVIGHLRKHAKWQEEQFVDHTHEKLLGTRTEETHQSDINKALLGLSQQARVVLIMYEYLGYQHNEISEITGMAIGTSKTHLHRAKAYLAQRAQAQAS